MFRPSDLDAYAFGHVSPQPNGCWHWTAYVNRQGYGEARRRRTQRWQAHRYVWELLVGPIPDGLTLDHLCHNADPDCTGGYCLHRRCVNPAHLEPVTLAENVRRGKTPTAINAAKQTCPRGHEYDHVDPKTGRRTCRKCVYQRRKDKRASTAKWIVGSPTCRHGHVYDEANTIIKRNGWRDCRACDRERQRARYWAKKAEATDGNAA